MSFASRLKEQRERIGLTQIQLATLLGVTKGAVGNYETGESSPKASILYQVFDILKCDANYLFQDEMKQLEPDNFTATEIKIIKKYRALDPYGQDTVNLILDREYTRCAEPPLRVAARGGEVVTPSHPVDEEALKEAEASSSPPDVLYQRKK